MNSEFIRKVVQNASEQVGEIAIALLEHGIETYAHIKENEYHFATEQKEFTDGCIYVAMADEDEAVRIITELGYEKLIPEKRAVSYAQSEMEKTYAMEAKRRKFLYIQIGILVVLVMGWVIARTFLKF